MNPQGKQNLVRAAAVVACIGTGLFLFAAGIAFGIWFAANFQIVPRGDMGKMVKEALDQNPDLAKLLASENPDVSQTLDKLLGSKPSPAKDLAQQLLKQQSASGGPFTFKFRPGERLEYTLSASMKGQGKEAANTAPVTFNLGGKFDLVTESVDESGNGVLRMAFKDTALEGDMMGTPFTLTQNVQAPAQPGNAQEKQPQLKDDKLALPLLNFLNAPVRMSVAPNGTARELTGGSRPNPMIQEIPLLTSIEFPRPDMEPGTQWESYFNMSVPGSANPMRMRLVNTFTGYKTIGGRLCAVIDQKVTSEQTPSQPASAGEALGMVMGIKPPRIDLSGDNKIYFDTDNGQLVHSEMDLGMHLDMSESLGSAGQVLKGLGMNMKDLLGDVPEAKKKSPPPAGQEPSSPLDLNMKINASVSLVDPLVPEAPPKTAPLRK